MRRMDNAWYARRGWVWVVLLCACSSDSDEGANGAGAGGSSTMGGDAGRAGSAPTAGAPAEDAGGLGGSAGEEGEPEPAGTPSEESLATLSSPRSEHGVAALDGLVYVVGGLGANGSRVEAYDPQSDAWTDRADLPIGMEHPNVAAANGKLYVAGGGLFQTTGRVFEYDPEADDWSERTEMPAGTERASACVVGFDTKVYVFGGARSGGGTVTDASAFDTVSNEWETLPALPAPPRQHCGAGEIDGILYIVGGRTTFPSPFTPNPIAYDPSTMTYTEGEPMPTPRGGVAAAVLAGRIFVFGGEGNQASDTGVFPQVEAYDPATGRWESLPDMEVPRHGFGAATVGDRIYLPGGATRMAAGGVSDITTAFFYE
jgi:N-acetylneuraminic acid mutarotase